MFNSQVSLTSLDIQQARIKFILFKSKLRSILYGGTLDESILSPRENVLGQWLYSSALHRYNHLSEVKELEKLNLYITSKASELVNLYRRGKIEEARSGLGYLEKNEDDLTRLLSTLQDKVME
ncbi:MAG: hypothetical protein ACO1OQ_13140 [Rufibacter sp.]